MEDTKLCTRPLFFERNRVSRVYRGGLLFHDFFGDERTLDTHIKLLRKNLREYSRYITTLRGVGYRFENGN